jgi:hypothetical protein
LSRASAAVVSRGLHEAAVAAMDRQLAGFTPFSPAMMSESIGT